ncbi:MAG: 2-dehydropantoate 2-reductase [Thermoplasmata archaeon]
MKLAIIGPGALGTFLAGILGKDHDILLLGRRDVDLNSVRVSGNTTVECEVEYTTDASKLTRYQYILLCTKSYDTEQAVEEIHPYINNDARVVSLQNGLNNELLISKYVDPHKIIGGVTSQGITYESLGHVIHAGEGDTYIGLYPHGKDEYVSRFAEFLRNTVLEVEVVDNIYGYIWQKVIVNACINPLTALTGLKNGALLEDQELRGLMEKICHESHSVAIKETTLPNDDPLREVERVASLTAENRSSMLQDIQRHRKTEIDCINGAVVDMAKKIGIETPLNHMLYALIKGRELYFKQKTTGKN